MHILTPPSSDFMSLSETTLQEIEISLLIPARNSAHSLEHTVTEAIQFFEGIYAGKFEIILIPNSALGDTTDTSLSLAIQLSKTHPSVRVAPHRELPGKGAALRTGLAESRGRLIFFTDADLPYELEFFGRAIEKLNQGYALVSGNRRLGSSFFNVPVELLPVAYSRHRLGLAFNRLVRILYPVQTTDTQAGIKAMTRELAHASFMKIECPGFFFDLEIFLTARARGLKTIELPVTLYLNTEKSTIRLLRDGALAGYWLTRIFLNQLRGHYS